MQSFDSSVRPVRCAVVLAFALGAVACGDSAVFGSSGAPSGTGGTGTGSLTTSNSTTSSSSSGGGTSTAQGGTGGVGAEGGSAAAGGESAGGSAPVFVDCAGTSCPASSLGACCWDQYQAYGEPRGVCVTGPSEADDCTTSADGEGWETRIECQLPSHCPSGWICCGDWKQGWYEGQQYSYYEDLTCQPSCELPSLVICDPSAPETEGCPLLPNGQGGTVQSVCKASQLLPTGYAVCGMP